MKKTKLIILIATLCVIGAVAALIIANRSHGESAISEMFAVKHPENITKIFMADMHGNQVLLSKEGDKWMVNDSVEALESNVADLLHILGSLTVRQSVPQKAMNTINKVLSTGSVKVEVYEMAPKFNLLGIKFFVKERKTKTYYMGPATQDNMANFALLEGMDEPYIIHVPGFRGFITPRFSQFPETWVSHNIFNTKITRIASLEVNDWERPAESFMLVKKGARFFDLHNADGELVPQYDTTKVIDMLSEYREKNFESIINDLDAQEKQRILDSNLFKTIILKDVDGKITQLDLYRMEDDEDATPYSDVTMTDEISSMYNRDRFYGVVNRNPNVLYKLQYYHFDRQVQPLSYFLGDKK
ncbi:MAG: hypothetical protein J5719_05055 [Bacteroidales bacterium]|nr:hypothetical protein [Bacteroidales bacterium]